MSTTAGRSRLASIDVLRGAVMVLMALDHVRVYSGVPVGEFSTPGVFYTRWVTHFCAPVFVFLAGTSAYLHGQAIGDRARLARFLVARGLLLVLLELTVIRASWTFGLDYSSFLLAGVIWMLGWCMVLLAGLIWLPPPAVGAIGLLVIAGQGAFRPIGQSLPAVAQPWYEVIYPIGDQLSLGAGGPTVFVLYSLVPWIGVMAAGYGFGLIMATEPARRRRWCLLIGLSATLLFLAIVVSWAIEMGDPALMVLLNQRKYPASVSFLLMTLGPAITLLPFVEGARGRLTQALATIGRVPMFYYLLHIPLIHVIALGVFRLRNAPIDGSAFATAPYVQIPPEVRWDLPTLYLVFAVVVVLLYVACRWFAGVKARSQAAWLRYF